MYIYRDVLPSFDRSIMCVGYIPRFETTIERLESDTNTSHGGHGDRSRPNILAFTRQVAILQVNEARLARQFHLVTEEKATEQSRREMMEEDFLEMEKTLKLRILALEQWKAGAAARIKYMETALSSSILKRHYDTLQRDFDTLQCKYTSLLEACNDRYLMHLQALELPFQNATLLHENALLKAQLERPREPSRADCHQHTSTNNDDDKDEEARGTPIHPFHIKTTIIVLSIVLLMYRSIDVSIY
jgi:hypothetical protein